MRRSTKMINLLLITLTCSKNMFVYLVEELFTFTDIQNLFHLPIQKMDRCFKSHGMDIPSS
jgi:hypothetical protein